MKEKREALIRYRIEQADESLESAKLLLDNGKYRPSVSRAYYAMFYAVLALLTKESLHTRKHSGVIAVFNREFVKKGLFDKDFSRWLQEAFDMRQRADYRELFTISHERSKDILEHAYKFVAEVKSRIEATVEQEY
jgi:uncharacterized protein (UPF0332 family)